MWTETQTKIYKALNGLMGACGLNGDSGTEALFAIISESAQEIEDEDIIAESHKQGLCYDVNAALALKIAEKLTPKAEWPDNE